jgi:hypothetical protein
MHARPFDCQSGLSLASHLPTEIVSTSTIACIQLNSRAAPTSTCQNILTRYLWCSLTEWMQQLSCALLSPRLSSRALVGCHRRAPYPLRRLRGTCEWKATAWLVSTEHLQCTHKLCPCLQLLSCKVSELMTPVARCPFALVEAQTL